MEKEFIFRHPQGHHETEPQYLRTFNSMTGLITDITHNEAEAIRLPPSWVEAVLSKLNLSPFSKWEAVEV